MIFSHCYQQQIVLLSVIKLCVTFVIIQCGVNTFLVMSIIYCNHDISFPSLPNKKSSLVRVEAASKRFCKNWSHVKFLPERTVSQANGYYLISTICKSQIYAFKTSSLLLKNLLHHEHFANITFKFVIVNSTWILWECVDLQCTCELTEITMQLKTKRMIYNFIEKGESIRFFVFH